MPIDLDELERLAKAATPLPWKNEPDENFFDHDCQIVRSDTAFVCEFVTEKNADYITSACNAVPELIAQVRELEEWRNRALNEAGYLLGCMPVLDCRVCDYLDYCPEPMPGFEPDIETCRATMRNFCNPNGEPINKEAGE